MPDESSEPMPEKRTHDRITLGHTLGEWERDTIPGLAPA